MGLNDKVSAERVHIGFFGLRNAGKSSVVNAVTGQSLSLVSETKGTTTDPVQKAMELLPIGPVVVIDTPGIDDVGTLGEMRVKRALQVLDKTDIAILVVDVEKGLQQADQELMEIFYPGLSAVSSQQMLVYVNQMSMNMGELALIEVTDSKDVDGVKAILQARIDGMINGGAWYPEPTRIWTECSRVVSNGNYILMVVHEQCDAIVDDFNALF